MFRKMFITIVCVATAFSMMPMVSFGAAEVEEDVLLLQEASLPLQEELTVNGLFYDEGDKYTMEDVSGYDDEMSVYGFYLGSGGQYGDAFLIESNDRYLLMDTGAVTASDRLVANLKAVMKKNKKLDVYISHMHGDHTGGLEKVLMNFDVGTVFFPDIEVCENYYTPDVKKSIDLIYIQHVAIARTGGADRIVYLRPDSSVRSSEPRAENTYDQFNVGRAVCDVIGPLGTYEPDDFISYVKELNGRCGTKEGHCINNSSLCTKINCGDSVFLATGDIEKFEEAKLVEEYGDELDCDVMKLPHHGLRTSCSADFAAEATAMWSFQLNHGYPQGKINKSAINTAKKYGYNYGVADGCHSIIFDVVDGYVRVDIDRNDNNVADDGYLKGWVPTGDNRQHYDDEGYIHTGLHWVDDVLYYFSETSGFATSGTSELDGVTMSFGKNGKLKASEYPSKVKITKAKAGKDHTAAITWNTAAKADKYQIFRAAKKNGKYSRVATMENDVKTYTNESLKKGKTYYYKVRGVRYIAGGKIYGKYSEVKSVKAR